MPPACLTEYKSLTMFPHAHAVRCSLAPRPLVEKAPTFQWGVKRSAPPACPVHHVPAAPACTLSSTPAAQELCTVVHATSLQADYVPLLLRYCLLSTYCCLKRDASALARCSVGWRVILYTQRSRGQLLGYQGCRFNPQVGSVWVAADQCFSLSLSLPSSLKINNKQHPQVTTKKERKKDGSIPTLQVTPGEEGPRPDCEVWILHTTRYLYLRNLHEFNHRMSPRIR